MKSTFLSTSYQKTTMAKGMIITSILLLLLVISAALSFQHQYAKYDDSLPAETLSQLISHIPAQDYLFIICSFFAGVCFSLLAGNDQLAARRKWLLLVLGVSIGAICWIANAFFTFLFLGWTWLFLLRKKIVVISIWAAACFIIVVLLHTIINTDLTSVTATIVSLEDIPGKNIRQDGMLADIGNFQLLGSPKAWIALLLDGIVTFIRYEIALILGMVAGRLTLSSKA